MAMATSQRQLSLFESFQRPRSEDSCNLVDSQHSDNVSETSAWPASEMDTTDDLPSQSECLDFGMINEPYQPRSKKSFPKKKFGQKTPVYRSFQSSWFDNVLWANWLHWETRNDRVYCFYCHNVHVLNQLTLSKSKENSFIIDGFNNWKDATRAFERHRNSACHREALLKWSQHTKGTSINIRLQSQLVSTQEKGKRCLLKLFTSVEYLARQGLPLRSHQECNGNYLQLLQLRANDSEELKSWLQQKKAYTSHEIQDEMLRKYKDRY